MTDWCKQARTELEAYRYLKESLSLIPPRIKELSRISGAVRTAKLRDTVVQGGQSDAQERLLRCMEEMEALRENYSLAKSRVLRVERGLSLLSEAERLLLDSFYILRPRGYLSELCERFGYEERQIYRMKDQALQRFALALYGCAQKGEAKGRQSTR